MADLPESFRVSPQLMRISLKLCYLYPYYIRNGTLETCSKRTDTYICVLVWIEQSLSVHSFIGYPSVIKKTRNHFHREDSVIYKHAHS